MPTCRTSRRISRSLSKPRSSTVSTSNISFFGTDISPSYRASRTSDTARGNACSSVYPFWNSLGAPLIVSIRSWRLVPTCTLSASSPTIVLANSAMNSDRVILIADCSPPHPHEKPLIGAFGEETIHWTYLPALKRNNLAAFDQLPYGGQSKNLFDG